MKKVLFTHSYFMKFDKKQWKRSQPYPPLMTITAASLIRNAGFLVDLFDPMFSKSADEIIQKIEKFNPDYLVIFDDGFNYLTKMCLTNMREKAFELIQIGKEKNCKVIICSSDSTDHFEDYLYKGADYVLLGEGERTLLDLLNSGKEASTLKGIAYGAGAKIVNNGRSEVMRNLDELPIPAWDLVDINVYKKRWFRKHGYFSLNMATTRGCPYKCNWCAKPIYGNRYNSRSPENVAQELKYLSDNFQPDHIWFCDDIFGLKPGWVQQFNEELQKENLNIRYMIQSRADLLTKSDVVEALKASGCEEVWMGVESGSQKILDAMDKGITLDQVKRSTSLLKSAGIKVSFFLQFGYLGETKKDVDATLRLLSELMPDDIGVSISYPLPGTKFYEKVKQELASKANWSDSDDLALMFRNTLNKKYYKTLHRYVHKSYRKEQGLETLLAIFHNPVKLNYSNFRKAFLVPYYLLVTIFQKFKLKYT